MESDINRLFHFTKNETSLESILRNKEFWVSFCIEDHRFLNEADEFKWLNPGEAKENIIKNVVAYPMVCFCDIPLERIQSHTLNYGKFGIGMKREWADRNNISPVQYVSEKSLTAQLWFNVLSKMDNVIGLIKKEYKGFEESYFNDLIHLMSYVKPYKNNGKILYNEREWRFYPPQDQWGEGKKRFLIKNKHLDQITEYQRKQNSLKSDYRLSFNYEDINCLIVPDKNSEKYFAELIIKLEIDELKIETVK